ncbi:FkbM family methyltransferase [Polynucleobacter sp. P1-05-14]|uniref:FkbM family methyltransferase n=1 Tax=Polynucleobacter sp. P1-05-14 TaxID=1819732 RepID=UPI001C0C8296|nr:FkbM family methyltransferase [Polynucleobacter sp. P1-05-14]MBU3547848.1 FkbM family methyltransferase [Polynucleobacter sp. P1-05-14]
MFKNIKVMLKKSPYLSTCVQMLNRKRMLLKFELNDIYDSYISKSTSIQKTPYGFSMCGSTSVHHKAMQAGEFESEETALFKEQFLASEVFVDIGANIGFYSCLARAAGMYVVAVEPLPKNLDFLLTNISANGWQDIEVFPLGLSDRSGVAILYGASSTGASLIGKWAGSSEHFQRQIALSTLDIVLGNRFDGKKLFIKMDVEGFEYQVLLGSIQVAAMNPKPTWVIEICLNEYHPTGLNPNYEKTFTYFWNLGYEARTADKHKTVITPNDVTRWVNKGHCDSGTINYIFSQSRG